MCGINGALSVKDFPELKDCIHLMNQALSHRGPDDEGVFVDDQSCIGLGHRRLSIIDLSSAGHQPMYSHDKRLTIVFNGEIYNFPELKQELNDYPFRTHSDTEVILAAYQKWGNDTPRHLNGMFAFAIWDHVEKTLFLARDRLGIKPLYLYQNEGTILFSSEIRSLLASGLVPRKLNTSALDDYLAYQTVHAPDTIIKDVKMLMPGHSLSIKKAATHSESFRNASQLFWDPLSTYRKDVANLSKEHIQKDIYELLYKAVEKRLIADVPFGAFLSGGIDSSIVVGLMSRVSSQAVRTFSVTFNESTYSEAPYAEKIARRFKTEHTDIRLTPDDFLHELPLALKAMDHPSGDGPNTYVVSKVTRNAGITMALSGLGGDELFAGYDIFTRSMKLNQYRWLAGFPKLVRSAIGASLQKARPSVASDKLRNLLELKNWNLSQTYPISREVLLQSDRMSLLGDNDGRINKVSSMLEELEQYDSFGQLANLSKVSIAELGSYLQNVLLRDTDQMSMASALEVRVPFLDHELVEYVLGVADSHKYPSTPKKLLVEATGDLLPDDIVNRKKMGFQLPWQKWLKNELFDFGSDRVNRLSQRELLNPSAVKGLWQQYLRNDPRVTWSRVWPLIVLEDWMETNHVDA